jgi:hypothetical protein
MRHYCLLAIATSIFATALFAQRRVDPQNSYHRIIAVMPLVGSGTQDDPVRPKYVPAGQSAGPSESGILAFAAELSDDGKHGIVELVAVDRATLVAILADAGPGILAFEKGRVNGAEIESAVRQYRKDFSLARFEVAVQ